MWMELTEQEQKLLSYLQEIPPDYASAEKMILEEKLSPEEISRTGYSYVDECFCDAWPDENYPENLFENGIIRNRHSTNLYQVMEFLLRFGLEPNVCCDDMHLFFALRFVDNEYVAADTMALLLEHGADITSRGRRESVFLEIDFDLFFDTVEQSIRHRFDSLAHCWMVLLGYGGWEQLPEDCITVFREFDSDQTFRWDKLRNHRNYYVGLSIESGKKTIHIFDKRTFWEVARIV